MKEDPEPPSYGQPVQPRGGFGYQSPRVHVSAPSRGSSSIVWIVVVLGVVVVLGGLLVGLGLYGLRRVNQSSRTAEARNLIGAIARSAAQAYEHDPRYASKHALCKSATPVPASVPSGRKAQPSAAEGEDFQTGDSETGWRCLAFFQNSPIQYQYEYRAGGGYKGVARGAPDPGPDGFEVSAEGDLDGDGKTSLFVQIGRVQDGAVKLDPQLYVFDEFE